MVLYPPAPVPVTVSYAPRTSGAGLATPGVDYETRTGTLTFAAGETEKTVEFVVLDDDLVEGGETVQLSLSQATASGIRVSIAPPVWHNDSYVIVSEDSAVLTVDSPSVTEGRSGSTDLTFTATLSKTASFPVKVNYTVGGTATAGEDYDAAFRRRQPDVPARGNAKAAHGQGHGRPRRRARRKRWNWISRSARITARSPSFPSRVRRRAPS